MDENKFRAALDAWLAPTIEDMHRSMLYGSGWRRVLKPRVHSDNLPFWPHMPGLSGYPAGSRVIVTKPRSVGPTTLAALHLSVAPPLCGVPASLVVELALGPW